MAPAAQPAAGGAIEPAWPQTDAEIDAFARYRTLASLAALERFAHDLDCASPALAALAFFAREHLHERLATPDASISEGFAPGQLVSERLEAVRLRGCPVRFLDRTGWASMRFRAPSDLQRRAGPVRDLLAQVAAATDAPLHLAILPEKDTLLEKLRMQGRHEGAVDEALGGLLGAVERRGVSTGFDEFVLRILARTEDRDYAHPDTRLLGRDEIHVAMHLLGGFGVSDLIAPGLIGLERGEIAGNLAGMLAPAPPSVPFLLSCVERVELTIAAGPGPGEQRLAASGAPIGAHLAVLGDGSAGRAEARRLTFLLGHLFERCTVLLDPSGVDNWAALREADCVAVILSQSTVFAPRELWWRGEEIRCAA